MCRLAPDGTMIASVLVTPDGLIDGPRLAHIKRAVASVASGVEFAALEGYAYGSTGKVFELGEVGGVIKCLLVESGIPYRIVAPVLLKKFATASTYATKERMLDAAKIHGHAFTDDNQADAFFLARIAWALQGPDFARCKGRHEMEVVHALRNPGQRPSRRRARRLVPNAV